MAISLKSRKRLWSRSGEECAFPNCSQPLFVPVAGGEDEEIVVGKECHIVARSDDGPRSPAKLSDDERRRWQALIDNRDGYSNLVLLCGVHHDVIDGDEREYTVERLVQMKADHEGRTRERRDSARRHEDEIEIRYASIVDEWAQQIDLDYWDSRLSALPSDQVIDAKVLAELEATRFWLLNRVWPRTMEELEEAFLNFRLVEEDLNAVVRRFSTESNGMIFVDRVYKEVDGARATAENLAFLVRRSEYYGDLAGDLAIELTRAVNLICERVRGALWPNYRLEQGHATIGLGFDSRLAYATLRPLYASNAPARPYQGLADFLDARARRDYHIGEGVPPAGAGLPVDRSSCA